MELTRRPFEPPEWGAPFYWGTVVVSFVILPFWTDSALRGQPQLRRIGFATFGVALFFFLLGLLFPAIQ